MGCLSRIRPPQAQDVVSTMGPWVGAAAKSQILPSFPTPLHPPSLGRLLTMFTCSGDLPGRRRLRTWPPWRGQSPMDALQPPRALAHPKRLCYAGARMKQDTELSGWGRVSPVGKLRHGTGKAAQQHEGSPECSHPHPHPPSQNSPSGLEGGGGRKKPKPPESVRRHFPPPCMEQEWSR